MNGPGCLSVDVTKSMFVSDDPFTSLGLTNYPRLPLMRYSPRKPARHRKPSYEVPQSIGIAVVFAREELLKRALQPQGSQGSRSTVTRPNDVNDVEVLGPDEQIEVCPH